MLILGGIVLLGAILRFATLDIQSFRYDETVTVMRILQPNLFDTLSAIPNSESAPPFYYFIAWFWSQVFGSGEVGLRSLSALLGTGSIVVMYLSAVALKLPRRAGLIASGLVAVSPVLIWFSQDARAYSLVFFLAALAFYFFAKSLDETRTKFLVGWAVCSVLAMWTHYFTGFLFIGEAALLLLWAENRRRVLVAIAGIAVGTLAVVPIALQQTGNDNASWIGDQSFGYRIERIVAKIVGNDNGGEHGIRVAGRIPLLIPASLTLAGLAMLFGLADKRERRGAGIAAIIALCGLGIPLLLAPFGLDYFNARNLTPVFMPIMLVIGAGFGVKKSAWVGPFLGSLACILALVFTVDMLRQPRYQREDLRGAAKVIGKPGAHGAVVTIRHAATVPVAYYLGLVPARGKTLRLSEIDLVGSGNVIRKNAKRLIPPGFRQVDFRPVSYSYSLARFKSDRPVDVPRKELRVGKLTGDSPTSSVLVAP
ncbi:MAG: glycosyltransferase family 39 protein [Solirubrobacterales bacterium]|nr:glycosyltransferase family 39 protein [Solirubrobacterales bacterium]